MKSFLLPALLTALLLIACGSGDSAEEASPLSVVPERAMISIVLNDPAGMVRNIDGYIEDGAPVLGENLLENLICEQLAVSCLDSMTYRYGFDTSGQVVFWMESAMPQSMGMAASAPDFQLFTSLLEEMGAELTDEEQIQGEDVYSMDTEEGTMYLAGVQGVVLMAMSSAKLEILISALAPAASFDEVVPASLTMKFNLSMIGPMAAAQMPMARMLMMQGMAADTTMPAYVPAIMDVYMDGIESFLTQADMMELTLVTGSEDFVFEKRLTFIPGSSLAEMLVSTSEVDMIQYITQGDVATVRFQMPPEIAFEITKAFTEVFTSEISDENLYFWASMASNGAVSIYNDEFMHMVAAYELTENISIEEIAVMYSDYIEAFISGMEQNEEMLNSFNIQNNGIVQIDGTDFYSMSMNIQPDTTLSMTFDYWLAVHDNALFIETAPQPDILLSIISGDYTPAELEGTGEMAGEMSLAGYLNLIMTISPNGMDIPEIGSDVIFTWNGGYSEGEIYSEMSMDGSDAVATGFAFFSMISAMQ
ncbi:MAG: hypothetical protein K8S62_02065 [Candidatus Sabulitectum sp.]|nr:hypothetical protein [Candidatus Sabulitectum sp.]